MAEAIFIIKNAAKATDNTRLNLNLEDISKRFDQKRATIVDIVEKIGRMYQKFFVEAIENIDNIVKNETKRNRQSSFLSFMYLLKAKNSPRGKK